MVSVWVGGEQLKLDRNTENQGLLQTHDSKVALKIPLRISSWFEIYCYKDMESGISDQCTGISQGSLITDTGWRHRHNVQLLETLLSSITD